MGQIWKNNFIERVHTRGRYQFTKRAYTYCDLGIFYDSYPDTLYPIPKKKIPKYGQNVSPFQAVKNFQRKKFVPKATSLKTFTALFIS